MNTIPEAREGLILVVEDEAELRFILSAQLRSHGFEVLEAPDGAVAIELAKKHLPDVVVMDIGLPYMNGIAATEVLKADRQTAHIPIIILTARSGSADVVRGLDAGAQEYLHKPFDVSELMARVRTVHRLSVARRRIDTLNSQLEAEVDEKTARLQLLYEYMRDLNRVETIDAVVDLLVESARRATPCARLAMFLGAGDNRTLHCLRTVRVDEGVLELLRKGAHALVTRGAFDACGTLAVEPTPETLAPADAVGDFLSVPLMCSSFDDRSEILGVVHVAPERGSVLSDDDVECLRSIADAAAIAIESIRRRDRLHQSVRVVLKTVGHLAEYRDEETTRHLERVAKTAKVLTKQLQRSSRYSDQITAEFLDSIALAAPMHDIGKVGIPDDILTKPGKLTPEEYEIMKTHAEIGRRVLSRAIDPNHPVPLLEMCVDIAHCHHERFDGTGYPRRLKGQDIPLSARIVALVDAYDAISSKRRYKAASSHEEATRIIESEAGKHFDPELVQAFLACQREFDAIREKHSEPAPELVGAV